MVPSWHLWKHSKISLWDKDELLDLVEREFVICNALSNSQIYWKVNGDTGMHAQGQTWPYFSWYIFDSHILGSNFNHKMAISVRTRPVRVKFSPPMLLSFMHELKWGHFCPRILKCGSDCVKVYITCVCRLCIPSYLHALPSQFNSSLCYYTSGVARTFGARGQRTLRGPAPPFSFLFLPFPLFFGAPLALGPLDIVHPCHPLATPLYHTNKAKHTLQKKKKKKKRILINLLYYFRIWEIPKTMYKFNGKYDQPIKDKYLEESISALSSDHYRYKAIK